MERVIVVCDECGATPAKPVLLRANGTNHALDLCEADLRKLLKNARTPRRGRPRGETHAPAVPPRRPGRPRKTESARAEKTSTQAPTAKRERKRITDPVILAKRRAALEKARKARADKRAAARQEG